MATPAQDLADASACFSCLGIPTGASLGVALWDSISQAAAGGGGSDILTEGGDSLAAENGDNLIT